MIRHFQPFVAPAVSHMLPKRDFWEAGRVGLSSKLLIFLVPQEGTIRMYPHVHGRVH